MSDKSAETVMDPSPCGEGVRRRKLEKKDDNNGEDNPEVSESQTDNKASNKHLRMKLGSGSYWLTRILILRYIAFVYFVAFLVALHQNRALIGKNGLLPANKFLDDVKKHTKDKFWDKLSYVPTVLWFFDYTNNIDALLDALAYGGLVLSGIVVVFGCANIPMMLSLWTLYHSIVNVGQRWYSFGWESQILETGFLAAFLCPLLTVKPIARSTPTSLIVLWAFRWLIFRIMLGAGLIKIRGDKCWMDLTCMNYHYETQPVPNPNSYFMHQEPEFFHNFETMVNHFVELVAPFLILLTRRLRIAGGIIQVLFQVVLIISGNLSFLNWLTITPALACFDDASIAWMFSGKRGSAKWQAWEIQQEELAKKPALRWHNYMRRGFNVAFGLLIAYLSMPIVQNLWSSKQIMNTSFDPLRIVNTYGAFGSITKERTEVIFQGTNHANPQDPNAVWLEYEFKCKPGGVKRRPCVISPYHYRLDWLMWFAAFQNYQYNDWLVHLAAKFLVNDEQTLSLIAYNPFEEKDPPKWVRAEHYRYVFTKFGGKAANDGAWWKRTRIGNFLPAISMDTIQDYLKSKGWKIPRLPGRKKRQT